MTIGIAGRVGVFSGSDSIREIFASQHVGTLNQTTKDALVEFAHYTVSPGDARLWADKKKLIREEFMLGVNFSNADNMANFICTMNGVKVVDNIYARPSITGAPAFGANQNRVLEFANEFRVQGLSGSVVAPRNHAKWRGGFNGVIDFGSLEEYSYGQNNVDITAGIDIRWSYYLQGTGAITLYYDHLRVTM